MAEKLKLKAGSKISSALPVYEGYETRENYIIANVGIDKIDSVLRRFIALHEEQLRFFLELPANVHDEAPVSPGIVRAFHKNIYYIDGCSQQEANVLLDRVGNLLYNDGLSSFGFGCRNSRDEIMFGQYNVLTIYSRSIDKYRGFFDAHGIEKTDDLMTAWDTFTRKTPVDSERYEVDGKSVFDLPKEFEEWGMYFAGQREEG